MAKQMGKYFIAIVPSGEIQEKATQLKYEVRDHFNSKYALKSPAHVTLKMPFNWNEAKEGKLIDKLSLFFQEKEPFSLDLKGIGRFGRRVIYIRVEAKPELLLLQEELSIYCKKELKLVKELSDSSYTPHMTVAFKDLKDRYFDECLKYVKEQGFYNQMAVQEIAILKKRDFHWMVLHRIKLGT